jgi:O-antigen ligase
MIVRRPFFGWGLGNFTYIFPKFRNPLIFLIQKDHQIEIIHPENKYLLLLVEGGIIYLISFLLLLLFIFNRVLAYRRDSDSFSYSPYYLAGVIAILSHNLFDTNLYFISPRFIFWLLLGLLVIESRKKNPKKIKGINLNPNIYFPFLIFFFFFAIYLSSFFYKIYCGDRILKDAIYFSQLKKLDIAERKYLRAIEENPYNPLSYYLLANLYQERGEKGDPQRSLLFYKKVEKIAGNYLQLYLFRGLLYNKLGKRPQARYWFNLAFFYDPYLKEKFQNVLNY